MTRLIYLSLLILLGLSTACDSGETKFDTEQALHLAQIDSLQAALAEAETPPGLIHTVFFWRKEGVTESQWGEFIEAAKTLGTIESVKTLYVGPHADTEDRDVVDHSYGLSLIVHFATKADHDAYQEDPIHLAMIEGHSEKWAEVKVYDTSVEGTIE